MCARDQTEILPIFEYGSIFAFAVVDIVIYAAGHEPCNILLLRLNLCTLTTLILPAASV
jgi:hypothetical protein